MILPRQSEVSSSLPLMRAQSGMSLPKSPARLPIRRNLVNPDSELKFEEMLTKAEKCYESKAEAARVMEDLVAFSLKSGKFEEVAILEITMAYIKQLRNARGNLPAPEIARKTTEARSRKLGELNRRTLAVSHLVPVLLNRAKKYREAVEVSARVQRVELFVFGKLASKFWRPSRTSNPKVLLVHEETEQFFGGRIRLEYL